MAYVSRDPFARQELHRTFVKGATCAWCGSKALKGDGAYRYEVQSDGGRTFPDRDTFCSKSCRKSYSS
jgi:hypothetical protein